MQILEISDSHRSWLLTNVLSSQRLCRLETCVKFFFFVKSMLLLPKKSIQSGMYLILWNFLNKMHVKSVNWCAWFPWICIVCAFVASHVFKIVRCYKREGTKKRVTMNCVRFRPTYPNKWWIIRRIGIVEFPSAEMLSNPRMRNVFRMQICISSIKWNEEICGGQLVRLKSGFIFLNRHLTSEVEGSRNCVQIPLREWKPNLVSRSFLSFCLKKVPWLLVMCLSEFREDSCEKYF